MAYSKRQTNIPTRRVACFVIPANGGAIPPCQIEQVLSLIFYEKIRIYVN